MRRITSKISRSVVCGIAALLVLVPQVIICEGLVADDKLPARPHASLTTKVFEFGTIIEGTSVVHDFEIKNSGNAPLQIQRMVPACGCTASSVDKDTIEPGGVGKIHVEFDSTGFSGKKEKTVNVLTNDPDSASFDLMLKGAIDRELVIEPSRVSFDEVPRSATGTSSGSTSKTVVISLREESGSAISTVKAISKNVHIDQIESGSKRRTIKISLAEELPLGELRERVVVEVTGTKGAKSYNIPVYAVITGDVRLAPTSLSFGVLDEKAVAERSTKLENLGNKGITLKEIKSDNPAVTASSVTIEPGKRFVVKVRVNPAQIESKKELRAQLTVVTDAGEFPLVVYGIVPATVFPAAMSPAAMSPAAMSPAATRAIS